MESSNSNVLSGEPTFSTDSADFQQAIKQSQPYVGRWNQLISTTNWEKGAIIHEWRGAMTKSGSNDAVLTDEAWSRIVEGVSPQHVGRLRRTFERFGSVYQSYEGLYWSHFYAAFDWDDAEMWLEGAVQNDWSVSRMRLKRWETLGGVAKDRPKNSDVISTEIDEETASLSARELGLQAVQVKGDRDFRSEPREEGPDFGNEPSATGSSSSPFDLDLIGNEDLRSIPPARLFESFSNLPDEFMEPTTAFKLAIIRCKAEGWKSVSQAEILRLLDALKLFAQAVD